MAQPKGQYFPETGAHVPEDKDQAMVVTPFGKGLVVRTRKSDGVKEVELTDWIASSTSAGPIRPAMLYSKTKFPSVQPNVGSEVVCLYGRGKVIEIRKNDGVVVVRLASWRLAHRSRVTCYLNAYDVQVVRPKQVYEMSVYERVERAAELKKEAAAQFREKDYEKALKTYSRTVDTVQFVQHKPDSNNAVRADLLVVMITCSNNAATCCAKLSRCDDSYKHAQQALALLQALEPKKGGKIHQELISQGHSDVKVFGEWKVKSLLLIARALAEKGDIAEAMEAAKKARDVIAVYTADQYAEFKQSVKQLQANDKEILKLLAKCKERRKLQLKKEKQRAQAMFGPSSPKRSSSSPTEEKKDATETVFSGVATPMAPRVTTPLLRTSVLKQPSSPTSVASSINGEYDNDSTPKKSSIKKKVTFEDEIADDDGEVEVAWHKDPAFLGGLGIVIGSIGTLLLLSQLSRRR